LIFNLNTIIKMEKEEYIYSNTLNYIKVDKLTISNIKSLKEEYKRIKEKILQELKQELKQELLEDKSK